MKSINLNDFCIEEEYEECLKEIKQLQNQLQYKENIIKELKFKLTVKENSRRKEQQSLMKKIEIRDNDIKILLKENEIKEKLILKQEEVINNAKNYIKHYKEPEVPCYVPYYKELDEILNIK